MATSEAQRRAAQKYKKANTKQVSFCFSVSYDADILNRLDSVENKQSYIKSLIRADIARANSEQKEEDKPMKKWYIAKAICAKSGESCDTDGMIREHIDTFDGPSDLSWNEIEAELVRAKISGSFEYRGHDHMRDVYQAKCSDGYLYEVSDYPQAKPGPWYAVQTDPSDDWGTGSYDLEEAKARAREMREDYPDTLIAVIDNSTDQPVCIDEIRDF